MTTDELTLVLGLVYVACGVVIVWGFLRWSKRRREQRLKNLGLDRKT